MSVKLPETRKEALQEMRAQKFIYDRGFVTGFDLAIGMCSEICENANEEYAEPCPPKEIQKRILALLEEE